MQKKYRNLVLSGFLLIASALHAPIQAQETLNVASTPQVTAKLISSAKNVYPGETIYLGIHQKIIPHWHTYWQNSGDSGIPTTIEWHLPKDANAGEILWPIPSRYSMGPITNYGYADEVTLPALINIPSSLKIGETFTAEAVVDWLVCKEECIPQQVTLKISLPVVDKAQVSQEVNPQIDVALINQPIKNPYSTQLSASGNALLLKLSPLGLEKEQITDIWFYPSEWGKIAQSKPQVISSTGKDLTLSLPSGEVSLKENEALKGVLVVSKKTAKGLQRTGFLIEDKFAVATTKNGEEISYFYAIFLAIFGGVILNLMPCVFPVLSIKALALVKHSGDSASVIRLHGVAYTVGILVSFALLAILLIVLKSGGAQIGWGFQFQSPTFVLIIAYLMFLVGLNLSGVFTFGSSVAGVGSSLANKKGYTGSFFTGVLATIVATPCTAPFMAAALGYAIVQPPLILLSIFLALGFGLALPYLLIVTWPRLQKLLPKPGLWMERVKQVFAFPMYAAAVWLVWVLAQQTDPNAVATALAGMVLLALAVWLYEISLYQDAWIKRALIFLVVFIFSGVLALSYFGIFAKQFNQAGNPSSASSSSLQKNWEAYSPERLNALLAEGNPVFLNFTAAWCISCLVNERVALSQDEVKTAFKDGNITYLKGDWTNRDPEITKILTKFRRSGVPLYVLYPSGAGATPIELPQILTPEIVLEAVHRVPSQNKSIQSTSRS